MKTQVVKKTKKRLSLALALILGLSTMLPISVSASSTDYGNYSQISGLPVEDLEKISEIYGSDFLDGAMSEYRTEARAIAIQPLSLEDPDLPAERIPISDYWTAVSRGFKGQIWITKDGNWGLINHGHASMLYGYTPYYVAFVEHGGFNYQGKMPGNPGEGLQDAPVGRSGITEWDNYDGMNSSLPPGAIDHTLRTYNLVTPQSQEEGLPFDMYTMIAATDYAVDNLLNKGYNPLANKMYYDEVNCATLVYRAYENAWTYGGTENIFLGNPESPTVIPKDLVEDTQLELEYSSQWGGDPHVWNN